MEVYNHALTYKARCFRFCSQEKEVCWMLDGRRFKLLCNILRKLDGGAGGGATAAQGSQAA